MPLGHGQDDSRDRHSTRAADQPEPGPRVLQAPPNRQRDSHQQFSIHDFLWIEDRRM